jgi:AcrR family transcriptional regulator
MLRPMSEYVKAEYVKAEERRAQARAAALRILAKGEAGPDQLALRHVAQEMDVPLSTLTYAYPSTRVLFEDLIENAFNQPLWDTLEAGIGDSGLRRELQRAARWYLVNLLRDPAMRALRVWQMQAIARNQYSRAEFTSEQVVHLLDTIAERSAEHYRVPHHVLGNLILSFTNGQMLHWMQTGDEHVYWATVLAGIDGTVLLADPRPLGEPHPEPAPLDYANVPVPDAD